MSGQTDLIELLRGMSATLIDGTFAFATIKGNIPPDITPKMMFEESEGTTLILPLEQAQAAGISFEFPCRMITLNIHSALDAVGFMARIATELAAAGMGVNPVAGFYHDHLFVPEDRAADAMKVLADLAATP